ncbi:MAG: F-box protein [Parachlamydiaceae bacterium]
MKQEEQQGDFQEALVCVLSHSSFELLGRVSMVSKQWRELAIQEVFNRRDFIFSAKLSPAKQPLPNCFFNTILTRSPHSKNYVYEDYYLVYDADLVEPTENHSENLSIRSSEEASESEVGDFKTPRTPETPLKGLVRSSEPSISDESSIEELLDQNLQKAANSPRWYLISRQTDSVVKKMSWEGQLQRSKSYTGLRMASFKETANAMEQYQLNRNARLYGDTFIAVQERGFIQQNSNKTISMVRGYSGNGSLYGSAYVIDFHPAQSKTSLKPVSCRKALLF